VKHLLIILAVAMNLVVADAVVKELAVARLQDAAAVEVVPGFFNLAYVENRGCAWGMFQGQVWPLAAFAVVALVFLFWKRKEVFGEGKVARTAETLLYAGIIGNLIDRAFRGYVVDMFDFYWRSYHFPCFNLADVFISAAAALLVWTAFFCSENKTGKK
jgi:signal peptidase II